MTSALRERVAICPAALKLIAQAPVEVVPSFLLAPEGQSALGQEVVHELRDRAVNLSHHLSEFFADVEVSETVVVVVDERRYPRDEAVQRGVVVPPVPVNRLGFLAGERGESIAAPRGD